LSVLCLPFTAWVRASQVLFPACALRHDSLFELAKVLRCRRHGLYDILVQTTSCVWWSRLTVASLALFHTHSHSHSLPFIPTVAFPPSSIPTHSPLPHTLTRSHHLLGRHRSSRTGPVCCRATRPVLLCHPANMPSVRVRPANLQRVRTTPAHGAPLQATHWAHCPSLSSSPSRSHQACLLHNTNHRTHSTHA
jgi:hypothetical protein